MGDTNVNGGSLMSSGSMQSEIDKKLKPIAFDPNAINIQAPAKPFMPGDVAVGANGQPISPTYSGITHMGNGGVTEFNQGFEYKPTQIDMSKAQSYNNLQSYANSKGPSPWLNLMNDKIGLEQGQMRDSGARQATQGLMSANDNLAAQGGLSGGDAARMQMQAMRNKVASNTAAGNYGAMGRTNAALEDQRQKVDLQKYLSGQEFNLNQANTGITNQAGMYNTTNKVADIMARYDGSKFNYGEMMKGYAADQTAGSGGGGSFMPWLSNMFSGH